MFGIENSNKTLQKSGNDTNDLDSKDNKILTEDITVTTNLKCTVIAALLHYFLLVTFTWTGLSAAQLYFLLLRAMKPLPPRFILYISLIGWGKCLLPHLLTNLILLKSFNLNKHLLKEGLIVGGLEIREIENQEEYPLPSSLDSCEGGRWVKSALLDMS